MNPYLEFTQTLGKLRESSRHAVIDGLASHLDDFKKYLHVEREVERKLKSIISQSAKLDKPQLILVCGNVGDGKSHILSHLRSEMKKDFENFEIHNDATEAHNPSESFIDTLQKVLSPFSDNNLGKCTSKLILAVNLGTLSNFLNATNDNFLKLEEFVEENGVLEPSDVQGDDFKANSAFQYVNFTDYQLYELSQEGAQSEVIEHLLSKVFSNNPKNPIYITFHRLKTAIGDNASCPIVYNYEFMMNPDNRKKLVDLIIMSIVKRKGISSLRAILNFIFDIIIPNDFKMISDSQYFKKIGKIQPEDFITSILPNYIFENPSLSPIFEMLAKEDPCNKRSEISDDLVLKGLNSQNRQAFFNEYLSSRLMGSQGMAMISNLSGAQNIRNLMATTIKRLLFFECKEKYELSDLYYDSYIQFLYQTNAGIRLGYTELFRLVSEAIQKWNGNPNDRKSTIMDIGIGQKKYRILQKFDPPKPKFSLENQDGIIRKFHPQLKLDFILKSGEDISLFIDSGLLELLIKVRNGYRPNKLDKNSYINFVSFRKTIVGVNNQEEEISIDEVNIGKAIDYRFSKATYSEGYKFEVY